MPHQKRLQTHQSPRGLAYGPHAGLTVEYPSGPKSGPFRKIGLLCLKLAYTGPHLSASSTTVQSRLFRTVASRMSDCPGRSFRMVRANPLPSVRSTRRRPSGPLSPYFHLCFLVVVFLHQGLGVHTNPSSRKRPGLWPISLIRLSYRSQPKSGSTLALDRPIHSEDTLGFWSFCLSVLLTRHFLYSRPLSADFKVPRHRAVRCQAQVGVFFG